MKYIGEFYSVDGVLYKIEVNTPSGGSDKELKLNGNPFVTSIEGDEDNIYSPIKCGGATIGILTDFYVEEFYASHPKQNKVTLTNVTANTIEWVGYITPSMYAQGFDGELEELSVDCIDGIAVLKDFQFEIDGDIITSFANIIFNCLKQSECYRYFYISDNVQFTSTGTESIIEKLRISQNNFFDPKKDIKQTDDDVAFTYYDVLFHLLQFLGYTLIVEGDEVFIIDYDAIRNGNNKYFRYSLTSSSLGTPNSVNVSFSKHITDGSYSENGTNIEMTEVYNKVSVKDEFNTFDNIFPTFGDESTETNITVPFANMSSSFVDWANKGFIFGDHIQADPSYYMNQNMAIVIDKDLHNNYWINFFKFYDSPVFDFIQYNRDSSRNKANLGGTLKYTDMLNYNGAFYYKWYKGGFNTENAISNLRTWVITQKFNYPFNGTTKDKVDRWMEIFNKFKDLNNFQLTNVIALINVGENRFGPADEQNYNDQTENELTKIYPFVTLKDYQSSIFGGTGHFLRITGKVCSHDVWNTPHKLDNGKQNGDLTRKGDYKRTEQGYIWGKLKWGDRYWDGTEWQTSDSWFKMYFWDTDDQDDGRGLKVESYYDKDFSFKAVEYTMPNIGDGIIIPCPTEGNLQGKAEFSIATRDMWGDSRRSHWHPDGTKNDNFYCRYLSNCLFISDLEITAEIYEGLVGDADYDSDTVYTNVIQNGAVEAMQEITFKVCTDDGKKPSYSSVDYLDSNGNSQYVINLYNKALYGKENGTEGTDGENAKLRQEEHYVFKLATQYEKPMLVFNANLHNDNNKMFGLYTDKTLSGKTFVAAAREVNYRFNKCNLRLIEKF